MSNYFRFFVFFLLTFCFLISQPPSVTAEEKVIHIYQDADLSNHSQSSRAIQQGIEVAFDEIGNEIEGYKVEFKYLDHRGNVIRSKQNYQKFIDDLKALAIYSGVHSPPLITNRKFINEAGALTLVPWAAGGPITRYADGDNWIFRLSVDDTKAGSVLIDFAMKDKKCRSPHLLLEDTPWGDSNLENMSMALKEYNLESPKTTRFGWNLKKQAARILLRDIIKNGDDCIILVANAVEGHVIADALISIEEDTPIISHWGITGGNFHEIITAKKRESLDLNFIQSCFAFTNAAQSDFAKDVFTRLQKISDGHIKQPHDLKSAVGFIHAYDLTKLLIAAVKKSGLSGDIKKDRDSVRLALEDLQEPIEGLVKTYKNPYSVYSSDNPDAHEALGRADYCMAQYGPKDEIILINKDKK